MGARRRKSEREDGAWYWRVLVCPRCGGKLVPAQNLVRCAACGPFPVLGEVPLLVSDPARYCAEFHAVHVVRAFAQGSPDVDPRRFGDDWTRAEALGEPPPVPVRGPAKAGLAQLLTLAAEEGPPGWILAHVKRVPLALEVGCGAGERSELLAQRVQRLLVGDLSLRAVLQARARASRGLAQVAGVVMDAAALPLAAEAFDLLIAENLVDLLDEPFEFLEGVREALSVKGRALVTSPNPSLGSSDDSALKGLAVQAGLKVVESRDGLPWLRVNSSRFLEVYLSLALCLTRAP
jgi:SAM-dependent methyltransferase